MSAPRCETHAPDFYAIAERGAFGVLAELAAAVGADLSDPEEAEAVFEFGYLPAWDYWLDGETRATVTAFRSRHGKRGALN